MAKTMAEVLAEHHMSRLNEGGWMCASFACSAKVNDMDDAMEHQAAVLSAAGYGLVADAKREAWDEGYLRGRHPWTKAGPFVDPIPSGVGPAKSGLNANPYRKASNDDQ